MSAEESGIPRRPVPSSSIRTIGSHGIMSATPRGSNRPPLPMGPSVNVSGLTPMPNISESASTSNTPAPKKMNPNMRMSSNWNSEHWKSLLGLKYIENNSQKFDVVQDVADAPPLPTPSTLDSKKSGRKFGSGIWSGNTSSAQVQEEGKGGGSTMSSTGVVGVRQQKGGKLQLEEGGMSAMPSNLTSPMKPPPSTRGSRVSFSGGVPFSRGQSSLGKLGASGKGPTRFMSIGRVESFNRAAGLKPGDAASGAYQDDAVVMTRADKPDPQGFIPLGSTAMLRIIILLNIGFSALYLWWRATSTITGIDSYFFGVFFLPVQVWAWIFYAVEICLVIGILIGHTQRMFPIQRTIVSMDDLVLQDETLGYNARCCIVVPSAGEKLDIVMFALLGAMSQRMWHAGALTRSQLLRVIILDEKRRKAVLNMTAAIYALATLIRNPEVTQLLKAEGLDNPSVKAFYEWWKVGGGYARKHLYNEPWLNKACLLMEYMEKHSKSESGGDNIFNLSEMPTTEESEASRQVKHNQDIENFAKSMMQALNIPSDSDPIEKGYIHNFSSFADLPTLIYYSRKEPGTPKVSPKAGNMNAALFPIDYPDQPPLVAGCTIFVVNDCRHQLNSNFLQRTVPYFFELDPEGNRYSWARVAFVQTPQRFKPDQLNADDPLGNHAAVQYDVINHGKDGIGAVSSSGHGSLWRVEALKGVDVDGVRYAEPTELEKLGKDIGFRSEMLVEDTQTSIDMFRHGWTSRYVNEPGEHLSVCTHQPNSIAWRIKQVLRWHQGAVQLLMFKGITYTSLGGNFPTVWHRIYGFDQATYYLQAIPGYILLMMPIIYGVTSYSPFETDIAEFFRYFTPFIVTGMLPTVISGSWRGVDSQKLQRDEQVWLSTTYVQIYAFVTMVWQNITGKSQGNAWAIKAPTWPLFAVFWGQVLSLIGALYWVSVYGFTDWAQNLISVFASALLCIHALWPMVAMHMGWKVPSMYVIKIMIWFLLGFFIVVINQVGN